MTAGIPTLNFLWDGCCQCQSTEGMYFMHENRRRKKQKSNAD